MGDKEVSMEEKEKAGELVKELRSKIGEVINQVQVMQTKVDAGELNTSKGVSFLEVKHQLLLSYIVNLSQLMLSKVKGSSIKGDHAIERLVEIRTVLEKMRPIDQRLKYQIDKLIRTAATGSLDKDDPLRFKPNMDSLVSKLDDESGSEDEEDEETKPSSSKIYKPPKLAAVHYDEDDTLQDKQAKQEERQRKKMRSSAIMKDLRDQYNEGPEEIRDTADLHRNKEDKAGKDREEYEMKYFVRMPLTKKDMASQRKVRTMGSLNSITHFGDAGLYDRDDANEMGGGPPKKKKKVALKGKKKSKATKKRLRRK